MTRGNFITLECNTAVKKAEDGKSGHRIIIIKDILYVIGGFNPELEPQILSEIRRYSISQNKWLKTEKCKGSVSTTMASHAAVGYGRFIIIHGGSGLPFGTVNKRSLHVYDTVECKWDHIDADEYIPALPKGLYGHTINIINDVIYITGGTSGNQYYNSVYSFDLTDHDTGWQTEFAYNEEVRNDYEIAPDGRYRHETAVYNQYLIIVGGGEQLRVFDINDIYFFDTILSKWFLVKIYPDIITNPNAELTPTNRKCHSLCQIGDYIYITGGQNIMIENNRFLIENLSDTWRISLNPEKLNKYDYHISKLKLSWEFVGEVPFKVYFHSAAYDERSQKIFMFGGNTGTGNIPVRTNTLSVLDISPPRLDYLAKKACYKIYSNNEFVVNQLHETNVIKANPSPA